MFPQSFYKSKHDVTLKRTANPTGILSNPLDLINHPRPWLTVETASSKELFLKKTLIFADHFYSARSQEIRTLINRRLQLAQKDGFTIFIVSPSGLLDKWDGSDIPIDYALSLEVFTKEALSTLAWTQHRLSANDVFVLDYFGINELIKRAQNAIDFDLFKDNFQTFSALTATAPCATYEILFLEADAALRFFAPPFVRYAAQLDAIIFASHIEKIKEIVGRFPLLPQLKKVSFSSCDFDANDMNRLLGIAPNLVDIKFDMCKKLNGAFQEAPAQALSHLKKIGFANSSVSYDDLIALFKNSPNLEYFEVAGCDNLERALQEVAPGGLRHLKEIKLYHIPFNANFIAALFRAAPYLEKISAEDCAFDKKDFLRDMADGEMPHLKKLKFSATDIDDISIVNLFRVASHLETIKFANCNFIGKFVKGMAPSHLPHLKKATLSYCSLAQDAVSDLCRAASNLEYLNLSNAEVNKGELKKIASGSLMYLKEINLSDENCEADLATTINHVDIEALCSAAPNLKKIDLSYCQYIKRAFRLAPPHSLPQLKTINLSGSAITKDDLIALFKAAANIEEIDLSQCEDIAGVFQEMGPNALPHLKKISLSGSDVIQNDIDALLKAAPKLQGIDLDPTSERLDVEVPSDATVRCAEPLDEEFFDTSASTDTTLSFKRYFMAIQPAFYRLNLWEPELDTLNPPPGIVEADDFVSTEQKDYPDTHFAYYQGIKSVLATENNTAIILPSIDAEEGLFNVSIRDNSTGQIISGYAIQHSERTRFYRIILPVPGDFTIEYQVAVPKEQPELPHSLQNLVSRYKTYTPKKPEEHFSYPTLRDYARYFRSNKTGSCQQRSIAAYEELLTQLDQDNVRIVRNDVHAYLEVKINRRWHKLELGGYPARLNEIAQSGTTPVSLPTLNACPQYPIIESTMAEILVDNKPSLVLVDSDVAVKTFFASFQSSLDLFIAHRPEDLSLSGASMTQEGTIIHARTRFSQWIMEREQGVICVDIREFSASELAQLNDLLDGRIEQHTLPADIRILLLDRPDRGYYGPDFRRRVTQKAKVPVASDELLLREKPSHLEQPPVEIDLFNSFYWQRSLIGAWGMEQKVGDTDLSFRWQEGALLHALKSGAQHIVLKNPPLHDRSFTTFMAELQSLKRIEWADQTMVLPHEVHFYQANGYQWEALAKGSSLAQWGGKERGEELPYTLSDANILSFIQSPCYEFAPGSNQLVASPCYLDRCKAVAIINVVCAYGLSESTLAQLLTAAQEQNIRVNFLTSAQTTPEQSSLSKIAPFLISAPPAGVADCTFSDRVQWQIHHDVSYIARHLLVENPSAFHSDMACLEPTELGRFPLLSQEVRHVLLTTGKLSITAPLSDLVQKLQTGGTVILSGKVPPALYEALTSLTLGHIERTSFSGQLVILVPPEETAVARAIAGPVAIQPAPTQENKSALLKTVHPTTALIDEFLRSEEGQAQTDFVTLERQFLQFQLNKTHQMLRAAELMPLADGARASLIDTKRLQDVEAALHFNPWVMLEGSTGIGKSYFLQHVLSKHRCTVFQLEQWLASPQPSTLVLDEASFLSELSGEGAHFLERFKGLRANPPGFLWKGKYHQLTAEHKVIFAFNPASYGAGRSTSGFLSEQALHVSFKTLPDFYIKERLIMPLLRQQITTREVDLDLIAGPLASVYRWLVEHSSANEVLITPREIKAMVNLIVSSVKRYLITDPQTLTRLAAEIAYTLGKQTLDEHQELARQFEAVFPPMQSVLTRHVLPEQYLPHQCAAYYLIQDMLHARTLLSPENPDLGLGGIVLEGGSGIGKTYFIEQIINELRVEGKIVHRISPSTPFHEKETILRQAFAQGAFVVAEEINTSLWPNKLLNNFLMGLDEEGNHARTPGAMLIATQNPPSFAGRSEEDPARRKRMVKLILDWPVYQLMSPEASIEVIEEPMAIEEIETRDSENDTDLEYDLELEWVRRQRELAPSPADLFEGLPSMKRTFYFFQQPHIDEDESDISPYKRTRRLYDL